MWTWSSRAAIWMVCHLSRRKYVLVAELFVCVLERLAGILSVTLSILGLRRRHHAICVIASLSRLRWRHVAAPDRSSWSRPSDAATWLLEHLWLVLLDEFILVGQKAAVVVVSQSKACRSARAWNLKLIDNLLPQLFRAHLHWPTSDIYRLVELAQI